MNDKYEVVKFVDDRFELDVRIDGKNDTVWLSTEQIASLFGRDSKTIRKHINNALREELSESMVVAKFETTTKHGAMANKTQTRNVNYYNLDMIISVGYRVKSKRGIIFRRWTNKVLKDYLIEGYAVNNKRMQALNKTIEIQNKMLANTLDIETSELKSIIDLYTNALTLIDDYDHQNLDKPRGNKAIYLLSYDECRDFINNMKYNKDSKLFGVEKEKGQLEGILASINQTAFGIDVYKSLEEKAANLLYFIIKDHPFIDGCKRIAAGLFILYLSKNSLLSNNKLTISNGTLTAITLLVAESNPLEKEIMIKVIMNILFKKM